MNIDGRAIIETVGVVLRAVPGTFLMAITILTIGILLGSLFAWVRIKKVPVLSQLLNIFISYVRGVPLIVHLMVVMASLPKGVSSLLAVMGIESNPNDFPKLVIVLVTYSFLEAAFESEIIRGAFQSVDRDQIEAGYSIGFTQQQNLRRIIIPQALAVALPLFLNALLKIIKALSLAFTVGVVDIMAAARIASSLSARYLESYIAAALVYWFICGLLQLLFDRFETRFKRR